MTATSDDSVITLAAVPVAAIEALAQHTGEDA